MKSFPTQSFRHRENQDGSWDSICMRCYLTAAHSYSEKPLVCSESGHRCDEASWLFVEPASRLQPSPTYTVLRLASQGRSCPPSALPRFSRPAERGEFTRHSLRYRDGQPTGLREQAAQELATSF